MSDIDKSILDFDPVYTNKETDIEYIIRTTAEGRDKYTFTAVKKSRDRIALEQIFGKSSVVSQESFVITGDTVAAFSSDEDITVLFRHDFGGGEIPVLYTIEAFTDVVLTSGTVVNGGAINYLYATFDPTVGVDGFFLHTSTTEPTDDTTILICTYTAENSSGTYVIVTTDIYINGSIYTEINNGYNAFTVPYESAFYRIGDYMRETMGQWDYIINSDESFQAYIDNSIVGGAGISYPRVLVTSGTWVADIAGGTVNMYNLANTVLMQGIGQATLQITSVTNTLCVLNGNDETVILDVDFILKNETASNHTGGIIRSMKSIENSSIVLEDNKAIDAIGLCTSVRKVHVSKSGDLSSIYGDVIAFYGCSNVIDCSVDLYCINASTEIRGFYDCTSVTNCTGILTGDSTDSFSLFNQCEYITGCKGEAIDVVNSGTGTAYGFRLCTYLSTSYGSGLGNSYLDTSCNIS